MVLVEPEHRARHQKAAYLVAPVVVNVSVPVGMKSAAPVCMLEQMRTVKIRQAMRIRRKARRYPVENHSNTSLVQIVHKEHEVLRRSIARRGSKISRGLITPGGVEGMLHDGQQFHMGEVHAVYIVGQLRRNLAVGQWPAALLRHSHPRTQVNLIN